MLTDNTPIIIVDWLLPLSKTVRDSFIVVTRSKKKNTTRKFQSTYVARDIPIPNSETPNFFHNLSVYLQTFSKGFRIDQNDSLQFALQKTICSFLKKR